MKRGVTMTEMKLVCLLAVLAIAGAFVTPGGRLAIPSRPRNSASQLSPRTLLTTSSVNSARAPARPATHGIRMVSETIMDEAGKLRAAAAELRKQAVELEAKAAKERREDAERTFALFDTNNDGHVDLPELRAGLESTLRRNFVSQLTRRLGRKLTSEEIDARIAEIPGGSLLTDKAGLALIEAYDRNGDGVLQVDEFAPSDELRNHLENIFRKQDEEEREARSAERDRKVAERNGGEIALEIDGKNDGPATAKDKALCALPYLLPIMDVMSYGGHLFNSYPDQLVWAQPLLILLTAYRSIPFSGLAAFFGVQVASNNAKVNKLVRFNLRQAINLDIALILPGILGALTAALAGKDAFKLAPLGQAGSDIIFIMVFAAVAYSLVSSALGVFPNKLPVIGAINRENPDREGDEGHL